MPDISKHSDTGADLLQPYIEGDKGLARALKKGTSTVRNWRAMGKGAPATKVGNKVLYHIDDVRKWLKKQRQGAA